MDRPLPVILAALLIDDSFRTAMQDARTTRLTLRTALQRYGFFLNTEEVDSVVEMVNDFLDTDTEMMDVRGVIKARCPDWPCSRFMLGGD